MAIHTHAIGQSIVPYCRGCISVTVLLFSLCCSPIWADQTHTELEALFGQLQQARTDGEASQIEADIWQLWLEAPDDSAAALMSQVVVAMDQGRLALALEFANQLVDGAPEFAEAWNKRATIHYIMGNQDASVADIRETLALEPRHFGAISGLGLIFLRAGNLDAALEAFEQVLDISPASVNAQRSAERVRAELGSEI